MIKPMWTAEAVKAYESGQGVVLVEKPYPHYVPLDDTSVKQVVKTEEKKHEWVGLTDEEIQTTWDSVMDGAVFTRREVYKAIEAKLKEKNNG
jgi:hypothetical protein